MLPCSKLGEIFEIKMDSRFRGNDVSLGVLALMAALIGHEGLQNLTPRREIRCF